MRAVKFDQGFQPCWNLHTSLFIYVFLIFPFNTMNEGFGKILQPLAISKKKAAQVSDLKHRKCIYDRKFIKHLRFHFIEIEPKSCCRDFSKDLRNAISILCAVAAFCTSCVLLSQKRTELRLYAKTNFSAIINASSVMQLSIRLFQVYP